MKKIGIFGGTFNPIHKGHIEGLKQVQHKFQLDKVHLVPALQNPLKKNDSTTVPIAQPTAQGNTTQKPSVSPTERLKLIQLATQALPWVFVDTQELLRPAPSYSIDTVKNIKKTYPEAKLFFIMGIDVFQHFDKWKHFKTILEICSLIVMSRPNYHLPHSQLPKTVQNRAHNLMHNAAAPPAHPQFETESQQNPFKNSAKKALLKTQKNIFYVNLNDTDISSSQIRSGIKRGQNMRPAMPPHSAQHIYDNKLYHPQHAPDHKPTPSHKHTLGHKHTLDPQHTRNAPKHTLDHKQLALSCADILNQHKGIRTQVYDVQGLNLPASYMVIASGTSTQHTLALSRHCQQQLQKHYQLKPHCIEGQLEGRWIVMDYDLLFVHLFYDFLRPHYQLEEFWQHGTRLG